MVLNSLRKRTRTKEKLLPAQKQSGFGLEGSDGIAQSSGLRPALRLTSPCGPGHVPIISGTSTSTPALSPFVRSLWHFDYSARHLEAASVPPFD